MCVMFRKGATQACSYISLAVDAEANSIGACGSPEIGFLRPRVSVGIVFPEIFCSTTPVPI